MELRKKILCKGFRDHTLDAQCLDDLRCLLSGGTAAEILACNDDVSFLNLSCQFRAKGTESILFHIVNCFQCQILCGNNDIGINIIAKYPNLTCKFSICSPQYCCMLSDRYTQTDPYYSEIAVHPANHSPDTVHLSKCSICS